MNELAVHETQAVSNQNLFFNQDNFNAMFQAANLMSTATCTVPQHLQDKPGDCMAIIMQSLQWGMNPYAVAQKTHIVQGTLGYEAQLVNAIITAKSPTIDRLHYDWFGPWENVVGKFQTKTSQKTGKSYQAPAWTFNEEKGCGVRVWATLKGEQQPRVLELLLSQATVRNSTLWASDPKQQLAYLATKRWSRLYTPDVIMGVYTPDELADDRHEVNITPEPEQPKTPTDQLKAQLLKKKPAKDAEPVSDPQPESPTVPVQGPLFKEVVEPEQSQPEVRQNSIDHLLLALGGIPKDIVTDYFKKIAKESQFVDLKISRTLKEHNEQHRAYIIDNAEWFIGDITAFADRA